MKIWLDAGHGGKDPGAVSGELREKDIALSVTLKLGRILENAGFNVGYTRKDDTYLPISRREGITRMDLANRAGAEIFVSIHCNAAGPSAQGLETFSYPTSQEGAKLSKQIYESIKQKGLYTKLRGTKTANFAVLRETKAVAALVELAFITNKDDRKLLLHQQTELAEAIAKGIMAYAGVRSKKEKPMKDYEGHWAEKEIKEAIKSGVMVGDEQGNFRPNDAITRAEMAVILSRLKK